MNKKLEWEEKYSVGVKLIDDQHKMMFATINQLIDLISGGPTKDELDKIIAQLVAYKKFHFATEEKYFDLFNYEGNEEHKAIHRTFSEELEKMTLESKGDSMALAFNLVDFLEDWLINHLMVVDQKYVACFREHGLK